MSVFLIGLFLELSHEIVHLGSFSKLEVIDNLLSKSLKVNGTILSVLDLAHEAGVEHASVKSERSPVGNQFTNCFIIVVLTSLQLKEIVEIEVSERFHFLRDISADLSISKNGFHV